MDRIAIWTANAGLFVLCCYLAASIINEIAAEALAPTAGPVASSAPTPVAAGRSWQDRQVILDRDLFAVSEQAVDVAQPGPLEEEYEETELPLELLGTAASSLAELSWAAVEDRKNRRHQVVRQGDVLLEEATVVAIERRRIVLERQGRREQLALEEEEANGRSAAPRARPRQASRSRSVAALRERMRNRERPAAFARSPSSDAEIAGRNPSEIFSSARILPKYEQGEMVGIQLSNVKPGSLFEEVGIRDGDVITRFNGIEIDSPQGSAEVLRELTQAGRFEISVLGADGAERTLTYELPE